MPTGRVYVAPLRIEEGVLRPGEPAEWPGGTYHSIPKMAGYDLHPDGERLLVRRLAETPDDDESRPAVPRVVLFEKFSDFLNELVPAEKGGLSGSSN